MLQKQVVFNVGGALSSYLEIDGNQTVIDLGKSVDFNPVEDFLLPLAERRDFNMSRDGRRYQLSQLFLSHLDNDHISAIEEFDNHFNPELMTAPSNHPEQNNIFNIVMDLFTGESSNRDKVLEMMLPRKPGYGERTQEDHNKPLVVHRTALDCIKLFHIPSAECAGDEILKESYANNLSLVLLIKINEHITLVPGDIMNEGLMYLVNNNAVLANDLKNNGLDFLITPHHGLSTSFPTVLFDTIRSGKVRRLNIISEKVRSLPSLVNRSEVDSRYYTSDYCVGDNQLGQYGVKTSGGHIVIDYSSQTPSVKVIETDDHEALVDEFMY